jgi:hypothetical protein
MFTRGQINILKDLSQDVLGDENRWRHVLKTMPVLDGYKTIVGPKMNVTEFRRRTGQVVETHVKTGEKEERKIPVHREMTFEELESALIAAKEMKDLGTLMKTNEQVFYETVADKYINGTIINKAMLVVPDDQKEAFNEILGMLTDEQKEVLNPYIVDKTDQNRFCVDGVKFVTEVAYRNRNNQQSSDQSPD